MNPNDEMITGIVEATKKNMASSDWLLPTFFIGSKAKGLSIIGAPFGNDREKDSTAEQIKKIAHEQDADFVLFIAESWTIKDQVAVREYMENRDMYSSMSEHPKAIEVVVFALETKTRNWQAMADILPNRVLGAIEWRESEKLEGRFVNLLGDKPVLQ